MSAPRFTMEGCEVTGKVVKVYDADTVTLEFPIPLFKDSPVYKWSCRIVGIDTAEMRDKRPHFKAHAIAARDLVREMIMDKEVRVELGGFDKYGRVLATVYEPEDDASIADVLVAEGWALPYDGKAKATEEQWEQLIGKIENI